MNWEYLKRIRKTNKQMAKNAVFLASLVSIILLLICSIGYAQWYMNSEQINVNVKINGRFEIIKESDESRVKHVIANLSFFPKEDYRQRVIENYISPNAANEDGYIPFYWETPSYGEYEFTADYTVYVTNKRKEIRKKVEFPIKEIPRDAAEYTEPSETIDSDNEKIISLANSLVGGEDDLFIAVGKIGEWVKNNIQYNLSTLTASASEPASWVLANRYGVCDEITNLFIALCRAVNIPAKFISGISYTESELFPDRWGPHGWAEVYFPSYGWVEYDITYGEFGFIDPVHIKMRESIDGQNATVRYNWLGFNSDLKTRQLETKTELKSYTGEKESGISLDISPEKREIGFDSYNIINVDIENDNDYYVNEHIEVSKTKEINVEGGNAKNVNLGAGEKKRAYWIVNIGELNPRFIYTFPVGVRDLWNNSDKTEFKASKDGLTFSRDWALEIASSKEEENVKKYSRSVSLECKAEKEEYFIDEENRVNCVIANKGNALLEDIEVCFDSKCEKMDIGIGKDSAAEFKVEEKIPGRKEKDVLLKSGYAAKSVTVSYTALDRPKSKLSIEYPENVEFDDEFSIAILLEKESFSALQNATLTLKEKNYKKNIWLGDVSEEKKVIINMKASELSGKENNFEVLLDYGDKEGKKYHEGENIKIMLTNLGIKEKIILFSNNLGKGIANFSWWEFAIVIAVVFAIIVFLVFGRRKK
jgi:hypothetical protein